MLKIISHQFIRDYLPQSFLPTTKILLSYSPSSINPEKIEFLIANFFELFEKEKKVKSLSKIQGVYKTFNPDDMKVFKMICLILELSAEACGMPKVNSRFTQQKENDDKILFQLFCEEPDQNRSYIFLLIQELVNVFNRCIQVDYQSLGDLSVFRNLLKGIKSIAPQGVNTIRFIQSARDLNIPCRKLANNTYQFGWGRKSKWFDSSFTDKTPTVSANLVKNKIACNLFLRNLGFPVPRSSMIKSIKDATRIANLFSYPVVIKPTNLDQGIGVYCDLKTLSEIEDAFKKVSKISSQIMIEEHIGGKDYRLQVCEGVVYWAIERKGPAVIGDGKKSIQELIAIFNDLRSFENKTSEIEWPLISLNQDIKDYLRVNAYKLEDIPSKGKEVKLRAANNISGGGTMFPVLNIAHQDNLNLAIDAAKCLRLDIAGIDLIIPDISISWKEQKAAICEVNAMPQISAGHHQYILKKTMPENGRIPTILFIGNFIDTPRYQSLVSLATSKKLNIGTATSDEVRFNSKKITTTESLLQSSNRLVSDPTVDAIFMHMNSNDQFNLSFPVDKFDAIVIVDKFEDESKIRKNIRWFENLTLFSNRILSLKEEAFQIATVLNQSKCKIEEITTEKLNTFIEELLDNYVNHTFNR